MVDPTDTNRDSFGPPESSKLNVFFQKTADDGNPSGDATKEEDTGNSEQQLLTLNATSSLVSFKNMPLQSPQFPLNPKGA